MPGGDLDGLPETLHALLEMRRGLLVLVRPCAIYQGEILPVKVDISCFLDICHVNLPDFQFLLFIIVGIIAWPQSAGGVEQV